MDDLELKQLEAYIKVYDLQSFSKAANEMFLSQPSISAYIGALETELQTRLIHRSTKEFLPTKAGRLFYDYAKDILSLRNKSIAALKNLSDCTFGSIDILASSVPSQYILPELLAGFHKLYPNIIFNVTQADTRHVIKGISEHKGEIGFVGSKLDNPKCVYEDFISEKLVLIAPYEQRFETIDLKNLAGLFRNEYFVMRESGSGTRLEYEPYLKNAGVNISDLKISAYFDNTQSIIHAVSSGLGLSIVSELAARHYIRQKMVFPIYHHLFPERHFYIALKKNYAPSAPASVFIDFIREYAVNKF